MRLYLAVAVLILAFVAYTEAQSTDTFDNIRETMTEFGRNVAEKAKDTYHTIKNSDIAQQTHNWFSTNFDKLKTKFSDLSQD